jgi:hypothetical protein
MEKAMPDETTQSLNQLTTSLEEVAGLLRQALGERNRAAEERRQALVKAIEDRPNEREKRYAEELAFRAGLLKAMEEQASILRRIEALLDRPDS